MGNRRAAIALAALVAGGVAAFAVWTYLGGVEERAFAGASLAPVYVVKGEIKEGTPADRAIAEGRIGTDRIPAKFRPPSAITSLDTIRGQVAKTDLLTGQIVGQEYFAKSKGASTFAASIPEGQVAISVSVDPVHGVANLIRPGDRVNILVVSPEASKTLFQNVDVIAVGSSIAALPADGSTTGSATTEDKGLVTFAVPLPAAQKIALAASPASGGTLYLTLAPPESPTVVIPPLAAVNLFQGSPSPYA